MDHLNRVMAAWAVGYIFAALSSPRGKKPSPIRHLWDALEADALQLVKDGQLDGLWERMQDCASELITPRPAAQ